MNKMWKSPTPPPWQLPEVPTQDEARQRVQLKRALRRKFIRKGIPGPYGINDLSTEVLKVLVAAI